MQRNSDLRFQQSPITKPYLQLLVDAWCRNWEADNNDDEWEIFPDLPLVFVRRTMMIYEAMRTGTRVIMDH